MGIEEQIELEERRCQKASFAQRIHRDIHHAGYPRAACPRCRLLDFELHEAQERLTELLRQRAQGEEKKG